MDRGAAHPIGLRAHPRSIEAGLRVEPALCMGCGILPARTPASSLTSLRHSDPLGHPLGTVAGRPLQAGCLRRGPLRHLDFHPPLSYSTVATLCHIPSLVLLLG